MAYEWLIGVDENGNLSDEARALLREQLISAEVIDARSWFDSSIGYYVSDTKLAISGRSAVMTISARVGDAPVSNNQTLGVIPAPYRPLVQVFALGQAVGGQGMNVQTDGSVVTPAISAGSYFKATIPWIF